MADEGKFEPGFAEDVMPSVPVLGAGSICVEGDGLHVQTTYEERLQVVGEEGARRPVRRTHELVYAWSDVLAVSNDARDPRVLLIVVHHDDEPRMMRFRPVQPTPSILADIQWMASNAFGDDEEVPCFEVTPCSGGDCRHCAELERFLRDRPHDPPS
jgi:hypothetical protein